MSQSLSPILYLVLTLLVGMIIPIQAAANASLGRGLGSPFLATLAVFCIAALGTGVLLIATRTPLPQLSAASSLPWWAWLGGLIAIVNIVGFILLPQQVSFGTFVAVVVLGQLLMGVLIDHFGLLRSAVHPMSIYRLLGVLLVVAGVYLVRRG